MAPPEEIQEEITEWLDRLAAGESDAAQVIWQNYFHKLISHARCKLRNMPCRSFDEEDVVLSAMQSFFQGMRQGRFSSLGNREELWKLLLTITARKAHAQRRRNLRAKRGGGHVRGESIFDHADSQQDRCCGIGDILGEEPSPELATMVMENTQHLLELLDDETARQVAIARLEGYTNDEIALKLGCARRTVERKLERIRACWSEYQADQ